MAKKKVTDPTKPLTGWSAQARTFDSRERERDEACMKAQVWIWREHAFVPQGQKRAVRYQQPVISSQVMNLDAWETLRAVLEAAGATTTTEPRSW